MSKEETENDLPIGFSTYGLITAQRILGIYTINLPEDDLFEAVKNTKSFYHRLMYVPLKNVFNGIILEQVRDYQSYAQKLFVDYLLSGAGEKGEADAGATSRENLEQERQSLLQISEELHQQELTQDRLIAESQKMLIEQAGIWQQQLIKSAKTIASALDRQGINKSVSLIINALNAVFVVHDSSEGQRLSTQAALWARPEARLGVRLSEDLRRSFIEEITRLNTFTVDIENSLTAFAQQATDAGVAARQYRTNFYQLILRVNNLLQLLPDYHRDEEKDQANRALLYFDADIGEEGKN